MPAEPANGSPSNRALGALAIVTLTGTVLLSLGASFASEPLEPLFGRILERLPGRDFTAHLLLMGAASFVTVRAFGSHPWRGRPLGSLRIVGLLLVASTVDELLQHALPTRSPSLSDWTANVLGITVLGWCAGRGAISPRLPPTSR